TRSPAALCSPAVMHRPAPAAIEGWPAPLLIGRRLGEAEAWTVSGLRMKSPGGQAGAAIGGRRSGRQQALQDRLLRVQAVLGLVEDDAARPVQHLVGDLLAAV